MTQLEPNRAQIEQFVDAVFRNVSDAKGYISLRSFVDTKKDEVFRIMPVRLNGEGLQFLVEVAVDDARRAAQAPEAIVFSPPIAVFNGKKARKKDVVLGPALCVECDTHPYAAYQKLGDILGPPTVSVRSGGGWIDPETGEAQDKLHLHWRLAKPAENGSLPSLEEARRLACAIVDGDPSNVPISHPIRWPGSWHRKAEPRLCEIEYLYPDREIDLDWALMKLAAAAPAAGQKPNRKAHDGGGGERSSEPRADIDRVRKALKAIPNDNVHWNEWVKIGLAAWAATGGSADGFAAWDAWSQKAAKYEAANTAQKWAGFHRSPPDSVGAGTLFMMAEEAAGLKWEFGLFNGDGQGDQGDHEGESEDQQGSPDASESTSADSNAAFPAMSLEEVHSVFERYLGKEYDMATLDAVLAVTAAEKLGGDPAWLLVISGPGNAKTETVQSIGAISGTHITSTIASEGALLSASPTKSRSKNATGGLLRKIGDRGLLVIKDVTSILSMDRNARGAVLAALREIHDGRWERNVGTDGGRTLSWQGRLVVIGAVTTAWDQAHGVIASMGDRFVTIRSDSNTGRLAAGNRAIRNAGIEAAMRKEMAEAVAGVIGHVAPGQDYALTDAEIEHILHAANIVTLARTGVETDYRGDVIDAHAPEMPTRFAKQLSAIMRGGMAIGMPRDHALDLALRCAKDSVPQLRLDVLKDLEANGESLVVDIRKRLQKPWPTIDRTLQALHALRLLLCREVEKQRGSNIVQVRHYQLEPTILMDLRHLLNPVRKCYDI